MDLAREFIRAFKREAQRGAAIVRPVLVAGRCAEGVVSPGGQALVAAQAAERLRFHLASEQSQAIANRIQGEAERVDAWLRFHGVRRVPFMVKGNPRGFLPRQVIDAAVIKRPELAVALGAATRDMSTPSVASQYRAALDRGIVDHVCRGARGGKRRGSAGKGAKARRAARRRG